MTVGTVESVSMGWAIWWVAQFPLVREFIAFVAKLTARLDGFKALKSFGSSLRYFGQEVCDED